MSSFTNNQTNVLPQMQELQYLPGLRVRGVDTVVSTELKTSVNMQCMCVTTTHKLFHKMLQCVPPRKETSSKAKKATVYFRYNP